MSGSSYHVPVLLKEAVDGLRIKPEGTYVDCKIIQMNDSSGIILMNDLNLIRYDASSNSIEVKIYGDEKFVEKETEVLLKEFEEVTSYIEWIYSPNGDSVNVPLNTHLLPCDEMYPFLRSSLSEYYESFMKSNSNVLLLIGPPGTGKTTFIRGLLSHTGSSAMVTYDASILEKDFVFANFIEQSVDLLVLEDSDNFLKARSEGKDARHAHERRPASGARNGREPQEPR